MVRSKEWLSLVLFPLATGAVMPVLAQEASDGAGQSGVPPRAKSRIIEEIVVTAQKREENLQDIPISISAFSGEALDARGVIDPKDLQNVTPGLQYGTTSGYSIVYLRGIGTDAFIPSADGSVATKSSDSLGCQCSFARSPLLSSSRIGPSGGESPGPRSSVTSL